MLSYRHAFHAGNHADVFKHLCLHLLLSKLTEKDKPLSYIDTHAAAGCYKLNSDMPQKNREFSDGIDRLMATPELSAVMQPYLSLIRNFHNNNQYPGSPAIAAAALRDNDKLQLMELHSSDFELLKQYFRSDKRVSCHHRDGLEAAIAICPPTPRRGLVLIDPPYELANEYQLVAEAIKKIHRKWPTGVIALWYPLLARSRNKAPALLKALQGANPSSLFVAELWVKEQDEEFGMHGSGMAFINLPWQLDEQIRGLLPELVRILSDGKGGYRTDWIIPSA